MVKRAGRRLRTEHLEVRAVDSLLSHARVAVIVGKHGHKIVERNRLRRRLRELARLSMIPRLRGIDLILRSASSAYDVGFDQLKNEVETLAGQLSSGRVS